ncbi:MAG: autotransporter-associated beta strand repeat-containing protein, partial [Solirubrobacteraceae bacterium]|nr:autotransporter-associated beta strand repeat-containing protein [Solirubrobacteraceae bacterium]
RTLTLGGALAMTGGSIDGAAAAQLVLGGNVTATSSASAGSVIGVATALAGARTFSVNAGAVQPELRLGGNITNGPATGSITKVGAGTMLMQPPSGNLYTGPTAVNDGRLQINSPVTPSIPTGALTIGDGIGSPGSAVVQALIEDDIKAPTTVNADGLLDMGQFGQNLPSLTINDGEMRVGVGAAAFTGQLSMTGGAITGAGSLNIGAFSGPPTLTLTSSATGPARLAHTDGTFVNATTTMTVNAGVAPEFTVAGSIQVIGGGRLIKQGAGTALLKGSMIDQGALDVNAGTLIAEQPLLLASTVGPGATFAPQASIGTSTVNGTLRPGPGTSVGGALSFGATGVLKVTVPSAVPAEAPRLNVVGAVAIASGATLDLRIASGVVLQPGTLLQLITNDLADAITGKFANAPAGAFTEPGGHALSITYAGGTGNDLEATVVAIPPTPTAPTPPTPSTPPTPPKPTSEPAAVPAPSTKPADLTRLRLAPKSFRAASSGGSLTTKTSTRSTTVRFTLNAPSTVEFTVSRERPGIRSGAKCVAVPKRRPAKAKRCTRLVPTGTFSTSAAAGEATLRFTGRIGTRALAAGAYELAARPTGGV